MNQIYFFSKALNKKIINVNLKQRYYWLLVFLPSFVFNNRDNISYDMFAVLVEEPSETDTNYFKN